MKKRKIKNRIRKSVDPPRIYRVFMLYEDYYRYFFPLLLSKRLFLSAEEDDFLLDGWSIRRFKDVRRVEIKDDLCLTIARNEGLLDCLQPPRVAITDWQSALTSLAKQGKNIIITHDSKNESDFEFHIGRIHEVHKKSVLFREFDADGNWYRELTMIPFSRITSITFGSRYVEIFSKYLPPLPI